jgi:hypothetical protein
MREIPLSRGMVAIIDDEDYDRIARFKWYAINKGVNRMTPQWYAMRDVVSGGKHKHISMHHEIVQAKQGEMFDHKDRNGLNNQRDNIRRCTPGQNSGNTKSHTDSSSHYKGVSFLKRTGRWKVSIQGKHLGYFADEHSAAQAYDRAAVEAFGEFAFLNFPIEEHENV